MPFSSGYQLGLGKGLEQLDGDDADLFPLTPQIADHRLHIIGHRTHGDDDMLRVIGHEAHYGRIDTAGQLAVLLHRLGDEARHFAGKMGVMIDRTGLEVGLVLNATGKSRIVDVHQRRDKLTRAFLECVEPLPPPLRAKLLGQPLPGYPESASPSLSLST